MDFVRFAKRCYILTSAVVLLLGVLFLFWPIGSLLALTRIVGAVMLLAGAAKLIGYFSNDLYKIAFQFDFAIGVLTCAFGALILIFPEKAVKYLAIVVGLLVIIDALITIQNAIEASRFGIRRWWWLLVGGIVALALGVCALLRPFEANSLMMRLTGIALLTDGIQNIIVGVLTVRNK